MSAPTFCHGGLEQGVVTKAPVDLRKTKAPVDASNDMHCIFHNGPIDYRCPEPFRCQYTRQQLAKLDLATITADYPILSLPLLSETLGLCWTKSSTLFFYHDSNYQLCQCHSAACLLTPDTTPSSHSD